MEVWFSNECSRLVFVCHESVKLHLAANMNDQVQPHAVKAARPVDAKWAGTKND